MEQIQQRQPETTRPQAPRPIGSGVRTGDDDGGTGGTVQVTWGALIDDLDIAGMTVGEVEAALQTTYHLAPGVQTNVNGEEADADTLLASGDSLEFVRAAGEKGGD